MSQWFVLAGGLGPYMLELWEAVARTGDRVTVAYTPHPKSPDFAHEHELSPEEATLIPIRGLPSVWHVARRIAASARPLVVVLGHSPLYNVLLAGLLKLRPEVRVWYMSDTNGLNLLDRGTQSLRHAAVQLGTRAVLGNIFEQSLDLGLSNTIANRARGIRNGIRVPLCAADFRTTSHPLPEPLAAQVAALPSPRWVCVARLIPVKNVVALASAFTQAVTQGFAGSLTYIGEGPLRADVEDALRPAGAGRSLVAGAVSYRECRSATLAFDGLVLASTFEPWGIVVPEALGHGVPVLATMEVGAAISLAMEHGSAVKLCDSSPPALTRAFLEFERDRALHESAARVAAERVRDTFSMESVAERLVAMGNAPS